MAKKMSRAYLAAARLSIQTPTNPCCGRVPSGNTRARMTALCEDMKKYFMCNREGGFATLTLVPNPNPHSLDILKPNFNTLAKASALTRTRNVAHVRYNVQRVLLTQIELVGKSSLAPCHLPRHTTKPASSRRMPPARACAPLPRQAPQFQSSRV